MILILFYDDNDYVLWRGVLKKCNFGLVGENRKRIKKQDLSTLSYGFLIHARSEDAICVGKGAN